ncbi:MAG: hypothetical protein NVS2B17_18320 [Candidatus Velthaea sp.]
MLYLDVEAIGIRIFAERQSDKARHRPRSRQNIVIDAVDDYTITSGDPSQAIQIARRVEGDHASGAQHRDAVANRPCLVQKIRGKHDGFPETLDERGSNKRAKRFGVNWIDRSCRLVEEQNRRIAQKRARD